MKRQLKRIIKIGVILFSISITTFSQAEYFDIYADGNVRLLIIDGTGRKLGYDPNTKIEFTQIPRSSIGAAGIDIVTDEGGESDESQSNPVEAMVNDVIEGRYQVIVSGKSLSYFSLNFRTRNNQGKVVSTADGGIIDSAQTVAFSFTFKTSPELVFEPIKIVNPSSIQQDISIAVKMNLITNRGIANSLQQKIENAGKQKEKGQTKAAINLLQAFINEVKAQLGKAVAKDAAELLIADAEQLLKEWSGQ